jgi:hypothetical protein
VREGWNDAVAEAPAAASATPWVRPSNRSPADLTDAGQGTWDDRVPWHLRGMSPYLGSLFPSGAGADKAREQGHGLALATSEDGQMALFAPRAVLTRDMEAALARGRFEEAGRVRLMIEATFGPSLDTRELGFLDRLGGRLWRCPPRVALSVWTEIDADLRGRPHLRARLRDGVFARLLESHAPDELVEAKPECLSALTLVLASNPEISADDGRRLSRGLIRDALLAGRFLLSLDFKHDEPVADLLAEDLSPRWLGCLGQVRRLWTAPQPDRFDLARVRSAPADDGPDDEAARMFWQCLCVADDADSPDELVHEARRRMKQIRPELHALYMKRGSRRLESARTRVGTRRVAAG